MKPTLRRWVLATALIGSAVLALWGDRGQAGVSDVSPRVAQVAAARAAQPDEARLPEAVRPAVVKSLSRSVPVPLPELLVPKDRALLIGEAVHGEDAPRSHLFRAVLPPAPQAVTTKTANDSNSAPPPLPFTYLGKQHDGTQWQLFLKRDNGEALVVREGEVIGADYRVTEITPTSASLLYLPMQHTHVLATD